VIDEQTTLAGFSLYYYRATLRYSAVYAMAVCPSVRHKSEFYQNGITQKNVAR